MRRVFIAAALCLPLAASFADSALVPVYQLEVSEICDALLRSPSLIPQGLTKLTPLPEQSAILAEGSGEALGRLREIVALLDQPEKRLSLEVGLIVTPAAGPDRFKPDWFVEKPGAAAGGATRKARGSFPALVKAYQERGGKVITSRKLAPVLVVNNTSRIVWLAKDFAALGDPNALATGVLVEPQVNTDGAITTPLTLVAVVPTQPAGARLAKLDQIQATLADGDSLIFGGHFLGEGSTQKQEVVLVIIPRIVFGGE